MSSDSEWRRLERNLRAASDTSRCFVLYEDREDLERGKTRLENDLRVKASVEIDGSTDSMSELARQLADAPGDGPVQLSGIEHWPGGAGQFAKDLNIAVKPMHYTCRRPFVIWARDHEVTAALRTEGGATVRQDLHQSGTTRSDRAVPRLRLPACQRLGRLHNDFR